eukprot:jgi/Galph1/5504/GphlegSOOS_G4160.1
MFETKTTSSSLSPQEKQIAALKEAGNQHMARGAFGKALRIYNRAIELDHNNALLYSNRSAAHYNLRNFEAALEDAAKAVQLAPKWWKAYKRKGLSLLLLKYYEEAIATLEHGLSLAPENEDMERHLQYAKELYERVQNLYILPDKETMKKLEGVPVFIVADENGQPFFIMHEDGQQVCTFYFDHADACSTLQWIKEENPEIGQKALVLPIGLTHAFHLAQEAQQNFCDDLDSTGIDKPGEPVNAPVVSANEKEENTMSSEGSEREPSSERINQQEEPSKENNDESELNANKDQDEKPVSGFAFQFRPALKQVESAVEIIKSQIQAEEHENNYASANTESLQSNNLTGESFSAEETAQEHVNRKQRYCPLHGCHHEEEEEEELTVENFNGIPIFQAKGLRTSLETLVESDQSLPKECDMDVGTLEDILQRMAEGTNSLEFDSILFVAAKESLKIVGKEYPLDEIHGIPRDKQQELLKQQRQQRRLWKKQVEQQPLQSPSLYFPTAKEVAAAGGSKEAVKEAILRNIERRRLLELLTSFRNLKADNGNEQQTPEKANHVKGEDTTVSKGSNEHATASLRARARAGKRHVVPSKNKDIDGTSTKEVTVQ